MVKVSATASNIITRAVGAAGLILVGIDAHNMGKMESSKNRNNIKAAGLSERYLDDMKMESPSVVDNAVKKRIFKYAVDENFTGFFTSVAGYTKGFGSMLVNDVIPLGLAAGTVLMPKGFLSKSFGVGLLAYGVIHVLQDVFNIGKRKD